MSSTPYSRSRNFPMIRPCNWCCRSGDSKRKFQQECAAAFPGRGQQANQLSFQRYFGPLDCFQHLRSTEMPNRCPATAQIWHCRIGEAPKIQGATMVASEGAMMEASEGATIRASCFQEVSTSPSLSALSLEQAASKKSQQALLSQPHL